MDSDKPIEEHIRWSSANDTSIIPRVLLTDRGVGSLTSTSFFRDHPEHDVRHDILGMIQEHGLLCLMNKTLVDRGAFQPRLEARPQIPISAGIKRNHEEMSVDSFARDFMDGDENMLDSDDRIPSSSFLQPGVTYNISNNHSISTRLKISGVSNDHERIDGYFESGGISIPFAGEVVDFQHTDLRCSENGKINIESSIFSNLLRNYLCFDKDLKPYFGRRRQQAHVSASDRKPFYMNRYGYLEMNDSGSHPLRYPENTKFPNPSLFHRVENMCGNKGSTYKLLAKWFDLPPFNEFINTPSPPTPPNGKRKCINNPENLLICNDCINLMLKNFIFLKLEVDLEDLLTDPADTNKDLHIRNDMTYKRRRRLRSFTSSLKFSGRDPGGVGPSGAAVRFSTGSVPEGEADPSHPFRPFVSLESQNNSGNGYVDTGHQEELDPSSDQETSESTSFERGSSLLNEPDEHESTFDDANDDEHDDDYIDDENDLSNYGYGINFSGDASENGEEEEEAEEEDENEEEGDDAEDNDGNTDELYEIRLSSGRSRRIESLLFERNLARGQQHHRKGYVMARKLYKNSSSHRLKLKLFVSINRITGDLYIIPGNLDKNNWSSEENDGELFSNYDTFDSLYKAFFDETDAFTLEDCRMRKLREHMDINKPQEKIRIQKLLLLLLITTPTLLNAASAEERATASRTKHTETPFKRAKGDGFKGSTVRQDQPHPGRLDNEFRDSLISYFNDNVNFGFDPKKVLRMKPNYRNLTGSKADNKGSLNSLGCFYSFGFA
ncbi:DEKNAAC100407 [Brettanomyces naardenensis]|uniref:DEKNAAC100407 n=1 Tax=Brettanomyces naardenensis TaxID=13370 RepID=A0A448YF25_BRENA|nr:DEKNAAC100407 [Brettanomyces naardenensis]